jgi:hypothetical protein
MKQCNLLSEKDDAMLRKDYQSPLCEVKSFSAMDVIRTSGPDETPIEWSGSWDGFLNSGMVD